MNKFALGFTSLVHEYEFADLPIIGKLPSQLIGSYLIVGPAKYELSKQKLKHWFDGFAMLYGFYFANGKCQFKNKFLQTQQYIQSHKQQQLQLDEFATNANRNILQSMDNFLKRFSDQMAGVSDNTNVNTARIANRFVAMTEVARQYEFDPLTLRTVAQVNYAGSIKGMLPTAHPHFDKEKNQWINIIVEVGKRPTYKIFCIDNLTGSQKVIATYPTDSVFYMHSFSITQNYIILFESPLKFALLKMLFTDASFNESLIWDKKAISRFVVINRHDGKIITIHTENFMCLHAVNAHERGHEIVLDLITYQELGNPYNHFYLEALRAQPFTKVKTELTRYRLDLIKKTAHFECISNVTQEFPRINYESYNGKAYRYLYAAYQRADTPVDFLNGIHKVDTQTGSTLSWHEKACYVGEPCFIPRNSDKEDNGIILALVLNSETATSFLLVLEAENLQELARVQLPFHIPFALHGNYYSNLL